MEIVKIKKRTYLDIGTARVEVGLKNDDATVKGPSDIGLTVVVVQSDIFRAVD